MFFCRNSGIEIFQSLLNVLGSWGFRFDGHAVPPRHQGCAWVCKGTLSLGRRFLKRCTSLGAS